MFEPPTFDERLCGAIGLRKLKPKHVAAALGVRSRTVTSWMAGVTEPKVSQVAALSALLKVTTDYLLGRVDTESGLIPGTYIVDSDDPRKQAEVPARPRVVDRATAERLRGSSEPKREKTKGRGIA